jgi:hypothetical protein
MGEAELNYHNNQIVIHSVLFFYGNASTEALSIQIAADIQQHWNEAGGTVSIKGSTFNVLFDIAGHWAPQLTAQMVFDNIHPQYNYFRIETFASGDISFVDGIGSNTGYFKLANLLDNSTTAAHEYGHTLGLLHPDELDIRGRGRPGIMYPRGTIVDPQYQYSAHAAPLEPGGTINPFTRKVMQQDIDNLRLHKLHFNKEGFAVIGEFTSVWHEAH